MNIRSVIKNTATAFFAQGIAMFASVLMNLLVPKVLGVESYGYWQLFIMYCMYSQFFLFGLFDGVQLIHGGKTRAELDKKEIASQFVVALIMQIGVAFVICAGSIAAAPGSERLFVALAFALYTILSNCALALGYVFQAVNETKIYSYSTIIDRVAYLIALFPLIVLSVDVFEIYIAFYLAARALSLGYCFWSARDLFSCGFLEWRDASRTSFTNIRVGLHLTIAVISDTLILGAARMLIDAHWGIVVFGQVSFALSMVNFFIAFIAQACMVLFPALRQSSQETLCKTYSFLRDATGLILPLGYLLYFPMAYILDAWLPEYRESLRYLAYLLPLCLYNSKMNICSATYMKVMRFENALLVANVATVVLATACSFFAIYVLESVEAVLLVLSACIALRSTLSEKWLDKSLLIRHSAISYGELAITLVFLFASLAVPYGLGIMLLMASYAFFLMSNRELFRKIGTTVLKKLRTE